MKTRRGTAALGIVAVLSLLMPAAVSAEGVDPRGEADSSGAPSQVGQSLNMNDNGVPAGPVDPRSAAPSPKVSPSPSATEVPSASPSPSEAATHVPVPTKTPSPRASASPSPSETMSPEPSTPTTNSTDPGEPRSSGSATPSQNSPQAHITPQARPAAYTPLPQGRVESVSIGVGSRASISGWAFDYDATGPIIVQAYVGGTSYLTWASRERNDVQKVKGLSHNKAGFGFDLPIPEGSHSLQVFAINVGEGSSRLIYTGSITGRSHHPEGRVESVSVGAKSRASISGWAFDYDASGPIIVQAYVDGTSYLTWANRVRGDVQKVKGLSHDKVGFSFDLPIPSGSHSVKVFAINSGQGSSQLIYSGTVYGRSSDPRGRVESVSYNVDKREVSLSGWAFDADADGPVIVQVYVGATSYLTWADKPRSDVQAALGMSHNKAGFRLSVPVPTGFQSLRVFVINVGGGNSQLVHSQTIGEQIPLFVYGTLRTGQEAEFVLSNYTRSKVTTRSPEVDLWVTPDPRDGSRWPWIMPGSYGTTGEALYFYQNVASQALARADSWEGYTPGGNPNAMNYTREVISSNQGRVYGYVATPHRQAYIRANGVRVISGDFNRF